MGPLHATDSATSTSRPENCLNTLILESSPFPYPFETRTPSDCRTENGYFEAPSVTKLVSTDCAPTAQSKGEKHRCIRTRQECEMKG